MNIQSFFVMAASVFFIPIFGSTAVASEVTSVIDAASLKSYCIFNSKLFSEGIEICARKDVAYKCQVKKKDPKDAEVSKAVSPNIMFWEAYPGTCNAGMDAPPN